MTWYDETVKIVKLRDKNGNYIDQNHPVPTDSDSVYEKDIWVSESDLGDFDGNVTDLFDNLHTVITNTTSNNPKEILVHFNRTVVSNVIGIGAFVGDFSNVLIQTGNSGGVFTTVYDNSGDSTKRTTQTIQLPITAGFNAVKVQFHTADTVTLSNLVILKSISTISRLQAAKPDDTVTDINATSGGNLKISLEEFESGISSDGNSKLNVLGHCIDEYGTFAPLLGDNIFQGSLITIPPEHHEIHCGDSYEMTLTTDMPNGGTTDVLIIVPDEPGTGQSQKLYHMIGSVDTESEALVQLFKAPTVSANGTAQTIINKNGNSSNTDYLGIYLTPTVTATGTQMYIKRIGSGKAVKGDLNRSSEYVLENNQTYLMRVTNAVTTNNYCNVEINYYVHPGI